MQTRIISGPEFVTEALFGIGLSFGLTSGIKSVAKFKGAPEYSRLMKVARGLAHKQGGHNKFLETIMFTLDIDAPRYWWSQFDTYRVGISKQSESTMHTIMAREITDDDFEDGMFEHITEELNAIRSDYLKAEAEGDEEAKTRCFMDSTGSSRTSAPSWKSAHRSMKCTTSRATVYSELRRPSSYDW